MQLHARLNTLCLKKNKTLDFLSLFWQISTDFQNSAIFVRKFSKFYHKDIHNTLIMLPHYRGKFEKSKMI